VSQRVSRACAVSPDWLVYIDTARGPTVAVQMLGRSGLRVSAISSVQSVRVITSVTLDLGSQPLDENAEYAR